MKTPGSTKCSASRMRSPSSAPCENGELGSTEMTPTVLPSRRRCATSARRQRRFADAGRSGEANRQRAAGPRIERADQLRAAPGFAARDRARERARLAGLEGCEDSRPSRPAFTACERGSRFAGVRPTEPPSRRRRPSRPRVSQFVDGLLEVVELRGDLALCRPFPVSGSVTVLNEGPAARTRVFTPATSALTAWASSLSIARCSYPRKSARKPPPSSPSRGLGVPVGVPEASERFGICPHPHHRRRPHRLRVRGRPVGPSTPAGAPRGG